MKILLLTQFYRPEPCAASNRNAAIAERLRDAGHELHVVTGFPNFPTGMIPRHYRRRLYVDEAIDGVRVTRLWTYASRRLSTLTRLLNWASLAFSATLRLLFSAERFDVLYVSSPPITLAFPAMLGALQHRARLVADIRDAYPEVAIRLGMWKTNSPIARTVGRVARTLYHRADCVICVTESMCEDIIARGCDPSKILVAPNGFDRIEPSREAPYARAPGEFVVAFVGNIGLATGVGVLLDAAALLADAPAVRFVLVGGGVEFNQLKDRACAQRLRNVQFVGVRPRAEAMAALRDADVCVVPLKRDLRDSLPTKLFDALSVGCPVIVSADGEARRFIERSGGGWSVPPEDPHALAEAIRGLIGADEARAVAARSGRAYVEEHYDRAGSMASIEQRIGALVNGTGEETEPARCPVTT